MPKNKKILTDKQQRFIEEYCIDFNATQAAMRAGYSAKHTNRIAWQLLEKPGIAEAIQKRLQQLNERTAITAERTLREYARIAYSDMRSFVVWGPDKVILKDSEGLSDDDAACVAEVSQTITKEGGSIRFKLHDKKAALDFLAKHLGLTKDDLADAIREVGGGLSVLLRERDANGNG